MPLAVGYLPWFPIPGAPNMAGAATPLPPPLPPRPLPLPRPKSAPGTAKSGFAALASRMTSSCLIGRRPWGGKFPGIGGPVPGGGGLQAGLTPRWETEVKCDASDAAGEREPSGISSYDELRRRLGSLLFRDGLEILRRLGFEEKPPGIRDEGIGTGWGL
jgi:hypothetical protein